MKQIIFIAFCMLSLNVYSQKRSKGRNMVPKDFIGTWKLTKLADQYLNYRNDPVKNELLKFTIDSVFIITKNEKFSGTWKLIDGQPVIKIRETNKFNYTWIAGDINSKFFTTKGLGYYKYFVRISKI